MHRFIGVTGIILGGRGPCSACYCKQFRLVGKRFKRSSAERYRPCQGTKSLLEAMAQGGFSVVLDSGSEAGFWWCEWNVQGVIHQTKAPTMYEAVKACWERGQGS